MKLQELGLKTKPETKYFAHGYISFSMRGEDLWYQISFYKNKWTPKAETTWGKVKHKEHLKQLKSLTAKEVQAQ